MAKRSSVLHISKRDNLPWYKTWAIRGAAILLAAVVCGVVTAGLTGQNPLAVYRTMFDGAFGTKRKMWILGQNLAILLVVSLAVTPASGLQRLSTMSSSDIKSLSQAASGSSQ